MFRVRNAIHAFVTTVFRAADNSIEICTPSSGDKSVVREVRIRMVSRMLGEASGYACVDAINRDTDRRYFLR
ncbi:hypothetical protein GCM10011399_16770 [Subtercola lobariae]|uniref:Uncharacterized protein n=1 Tax=Subtercola lobariae TaxID=1588641 RepID=A0A917EY99_9MICO|nr:hypothetical protein GCM10011399_16770 [Subtercola lobariae]